MSKDKLTDMSIDPSTLKGNKSVEVTDANGNKSFKKSTRKAPFHYISHHKGHGDYRNSICVKKGNEVRKVARKGVEKLFIAEGWSYCPRKEWKAKVRDA